MQFAVQASNPRIVKEIEVNGDESLSELIETLFPLESEYAFVIWCGIFVPLNYKYDISIIVDDIVHIVKEITKNETGDICVFWPSSTFRADWTITWNKESVRISAKWHSVIGGIEIVLNSFPEIKLTKENFVSEWCEILRFINSQAVNAKNSREFYEIETILNKNKKRGIFYTSAE